MLVAGIMSGTSVDAIDVAFVEIRGDGIDLDVKLVGFHEHSFPPGVPAEIRAASDSAVTAADVSRLHFRLGEVFAEALEHASRACGIGLSALDLVGSHGQTIHHEVPVRSGERSVVPNTLQIGEASCIARVSGCPVVSDFRSADICAGGQGAPLVPYADYLLFRHDQRGRVALNIGGIANVTAIPAAQDASEVLAFDTGPGNMVIDALVARVTNGAQTFDQDGDMADRGEINQDAVSAFLDHPYFSQPAPKSTGRELFGPPYADALASATGSGGPDLIATATGLTVRSILLGIERLVRPRMRIDDLIVSGGGCRNRVLMRGLREGLPRTNVCRSDDFGVPHGAKEAIAFAMLAHATFHCRPSNLPSATGASQPVVLGKITQMPAS